jgi:uncharacterized OsmC-like protein
MSQAITTEQRIVNGYNAAQLADTVEAIKAQPSLAEFQFRATNQWINGGLNRTIIKDFYGAGQEDTSRSQPFIVHADEPAVLLGEDSAPNPVEYVLTALAACLTTSLVFQAALRGIEIESIESSLTGNADLQGFLGLRDDVRNGYENISVTFRIKSDAPAELLEELSKTSPVFDIISNPVPVTVRVEKQ